jgi:hypothetical protein
MPIPAQTFGYQGFKIEKLYEIAASFSFIESDFTLKIKIA